MARIERQGWYWFVVPLSPREEAIALSLGVNPGVYYYTRAEAQEQADRLKEAARRSQQKVPLPEITREGDFHSRKPQTEGRRERKISDRQQRYAKMGIGPATAASLHTRGLSPEDVERLPVSQLARRLNASMSSASFVKEKVGAGLTAERAAKAAELVAEVQETTRTSEN